MYRNLIKKIARLFAQETTEAKKDKRLKKPDGDSIHATPPTRMKDRMCPLFRQFCMLKKCEWFMEADDECAMYRIARCIL